MNNSCFDLTPGRILFVTCFLLVLPHLALAGSISNTDLQAGATTNYTLNFTLDSDTLGVSESLTIQFPAVGFDVEDALIASSTTINGGFSVSGSGNTVTVTRDGTGTTASGAGHDLSFGIVTNPTTLPASGTITISTPRGEVDDAAVTITPAALGSFTLSGTPTSLTAGDDFPGPVTVTALDIFGNTKTDYTGTVVWSSTDTHGSTVLPSNYTFTGADNGTQPFAGSEFNLKTAGGQTITVADGSISETSNTITVNVAGLSDFTLSAGSPQTAGTGFPLNVTGAVDAFGNAWSGTITVSVSSGGGNSPNGTAPSLSNITVSNGSGSASQVLTNALATVLQGTANSETRNTGPITVNPAALGSFTMTGPPTSITAGQSFPSPTNDVIVTAFDTYGNQKTNYGGSVTWSSTDGSATLPDTDLTFSGASKTFSGDDFILRTPGGQTITVTDGAVSRSSGSITVNPGAIDSFVLSNPATQTAGVGFVLSVSNAVDASGNAASGTVSITFASGTHEAPNGEQPSLSNITVTNGSGSASQVLVLAESGVVLRGTSGSATDDTSPFTVEPGALGSFTMSGQPGSVTAGQAFTSPVTVTARDIYTNTKTNYVGTVSWSSTDGAADLPSDYTFTGADAGSRDFPGSEFTLNTGGGHTITVADGPIERESSVINVTAATIASFTLSNPGTQTAGEGFTLSVSDARDGSGNLTSGVVSVSFADGGSHLAPGGQTPTLADITVTNGSGSASQTLVLAESDVELRGTSGSTTDDTNPFDVDAAALDHFTFNSIGIQTAGSNFSVTVNARDAFDNAVSHTGTVTLTDNTGTLTASDLNFSAQNSQTINDANITKAQSSVALTASGSGQLGQSNSFTVNPAALSNFTVTNTSGGNITTQTAGQAFDILLTAKDDFNNTVTGFGGTVGIALNTGSISPTTSGSFSSGVRTESVTIPAAGNDRVIQVSGGGGSGSSNAFNVVSQSVQSFEILTIASPQTAGEPFLVTIRAKDGLNGGGNVATDFTGTVNLSLNSGTVSPTVSGNFSNGEWTGNITVESLAGSSTGKVLNVDDGAGNTGASNSFDVNPGAPDGEVTLTANPNTVPADGVATSTITSSVIQDEFGNNVGSGKLFTVSLNPDNLGSIVDADADPGTAGLQVATTDDTLDFDFQAGTTGGTVTVFVSSVSGGASGNTSIAIGSMSISSISTSPAFVTQGQTGITVQMVVDNTSASTITNIDGSLTFTDSGANPRTSEYAQTRTDGVTEIPAQSSRTLIFDVAVDAGAFLDVITIDGDASGNIGATQVSASEALSKDSWTVQLPAQIRVDVVNTAVDTTIIGQTGYPVTVTVTNPAPGGAADAIIDSLNLTFTKDGFDSTSYFPQFPSGSNPASIPAGQQLAFDFTVNVGSALADTGRFVIDAEVRAQDANAENLTLEDLNANTTDSWFVTGAPNLQILSMSPVPATSKIAGQTDPWTVRMELRNNGSDPIDLDFSSVNTFVRFFKGITNVTGQYSITQPTQLLNSGGSSLGSGVTDFLDFTVTQTGTSSGTITIEGQVGGIDTGTQNPIFDDTDDGGKGQVEVLSQEGTVVVLSTTPNTENVSQGIGIVNTGQTFNVNVQISNGLGEAVENVQVQLTTNGASGINPPVTRTIASIPAGGTGNLSFGVTAAQNPGSETFVASITDGGTGAQSGQEAPVGTPVDNDAVFNLQMPAALSVQFTRLETTQTTGDTFAVEATVSNAGQSQVSSNGQLTLTPGPNYLIASGDSTQFFTVGTPVEWEVKAPDVPFPPETFTVEITQSPTEFNTGLPAGISNGTATRNVETQDVDLAIQSWEIISPTGATDDTVSTSQNFDFRATFTASDNLDSIRARITLPNAYNLEGGFVDDVLVPNGQTTVTWTVESPSEAVLDPRTFSVTIFGFDNGELLESPFATRQVVTVPEAILSVTNFRVAAPNPGDTQVSVGLQFVLEATVINGPQAADLEGSAFLNLDLLSSGITTTDNLTKPFTVGTPVQWNVLAPSVPRGPDPIRVSIQTIPLDENKNTQARVQTGQLELDITTVDVATMSIDSVFVVSPAGAADGTISTEQNNIVVAAEVSWSDEAENRAASVELPVGYSAISNITQPLDFQTNEQTVQWILQAPETPRATAFIRFRASGRDQSSGSTINAAPDSIGFVVVQRAALQLNASITDPPSATDNSLTADQTFTLTARLEKQGQAAVIGVDTVGLQLPLPTGYSLIAGEDAIKPIVPGASTSWRIKAPNRQDPSPVTLTVVMEDHAAQDENTEAVTDLSPNPPVRQISVITQTIGLETRVLADNEATVIQGTDDQKLFGLSFFNDSDAIIEIESITFNLRDGSGRTVPPNSVFTRLAVADNANPSVVYGQLSPLPGSAPVIINFNPRITVQDGGEIALAVVADLASETAGTSFRFSIDAPASDIVARVQSDTAQVDIKDENGNPLSTAISIAPISVIEEGLETSFFNYPNPFGVSSDINRLQTAFHYILPQDSDISVRIYTMFGELVWSRSFSATDVQGRAGKHDGQGVDAITWDGRNDRGQKVLNGVYIAVLSTDSGKATTKIAVAR